MTTTIQPDPSVIGGVPTAPLAFLPDPVAVFDTRAGRFAYLADHGGNLAPYLRFLADLTALQARLARDLPAVAPVPADRVRIARESRLPPIDRAALAADEGMHATLDRFLAEAAALTMPEPARLALSAVTAAGLADRHWLLDNILSDRIPDDSAAPHLFVGAAVQVRLARLAATLDGTQLVKIRTGTCPACGGRPATSSVMGGAAGIESTRYAACGCCATRWNEVRVVCLCCGSNAAISYRSAETDKATVKAEVCGDCNSWVKILYQVQNASLDPVADDVSSLGLDMLMKDTPFRRGGFNPFIAGY
ncbi:formate dehydrogenase accessory protein FdhE [Paracoccus sediminis]|uniref:Formate dehydrogenase accessory protein FdhE n=1 Tax=Paracoccus sediminis TaxID=1214787 RepID=A0A238XIP1_9RHOB|nr:formate dehydrogenase accessory protein FdhE [Paracoccus sediminis]TBN48517.1 formate dehydrogenase accessory protein FdhE [Paracoccus sediminis]SNR58343.1 Tat proofreading chaperone FdhE [Paracoccus sediminis]